MCRAKLEGVKTSLGQKRERKGEIDAYPTNISLCQDGFIGTYSL